MIASAARIASIISYAIFLSLDVRLTNLSTDKRTTPRSPSISTRVGAGSSEVSVHCCVMAMRGSGFRGGVDGSLCAGCGEAGLGHGQPQLAVMSAASAMARVGVVARSGMAGNSHLFRVECKFRGRDQKVRAVIVDPAVASKIVASISGRDGLVGSVARGPPCVQLAIAWWAAERTDGMGVSGVWPCGEDSASGCGCAFFLVDVVSGTCNGWLGRRKL
ncbi:MAG: hypothetical protein FWD57_07675 [Polyangiaceae bacterium]|nr:hypothetical protein [Polyangiaceae bacterium]